MTRSAGIMSTLVLAGCVAAPSDPSGAQDDMRMWVEDGVEIVEIAGLHVADSTSWSIEVEPFLSIGELEGEPEYLFGRVRGVMMLPSDEILVGDGQAIELRRYNLNGRYLGTHGRAGDGPGEFIGITDIRPLDDDSIMVVNDHEGHRVHVFDPALGFVRRSRPRLSEMSAELPFTSDMLEAVYASGDLLMGDYRGCDFPEVGACTDSVRFYRTDETGKALASFGTHTFTRSVMLRGEGLPNFRWSYPRPQPLWAIGGDTFYYIDSKRREILAFGPDGTLLRRTRIAGSAPRWSRDEVFPTRLVTIGDPPPGLEERIETMRSTPLPDTFPTFADAVVDRDGWLWLREYLPPGVGAERTPRWYVFDPEGRLRHAVVAPPGTVREWDTVSRRPEPWIGEDVVLGTTMDGLGVERVVGYRITRRE